MCWGKKEVENQQPGQETLSLCHLHNCERGVCMGGWQDEVQRLHGELWGLCNWPALWKTRVPTDHGQWTQSLQIRDWVTVLGKCWKMEKGTCVSVVQGSSTQWCSLRDTQVYAVYPLEMVQNFRMTTGKCAKIRISMFCDITFAFPFKKFALYHIDFHRSCAHRLKTRVLISASI